MVGMLRLIGISRRSIVLEILVEGVVVAIAGAIFGVLIAAGAQYGINRFFQARYDTTLVFVRVTASIVDPLSRHRPAGRGGDRSGGGLDAVAPRSGFTDPPMTGFALARRTAARYKARTTLAVAGVAIIAALNFDMLLLSRGLLLSFADMIDSAGFDVRVTGSTGLPTLRIPVAGAAKLADDIRRLPEVEDVAIVRFEQALASAPDGRERSISLLGTSEGSTRGGWTIVRGRNLDASRSSDTPAGRDHATACRRLRRRARIGPARSCRRAWRAFSPPLSRLSHRRHRRLQLRSRRRVHRGDDARGLSGTRGERSRATRRMSCSWRRNRKRVRMRRSRPSLACVRICTCIRTRK